jgi:lactam utilization protein B
MTMQVDINSDIGEGVGDDEAMLNVATSVNVACGFHAGDPDTMRKIAAMARKRDVGIGAHPSYRDLAGFGRHPMPGLSASEIENLVAYQTGALCAIASLADHKVSHVKAHGALSNAACADAKIANAIAAAIKAVDPGLAFMVLPQTELARAADRAGLRPIHEIYADRAYRTTRSFCRAARAARCCTTRMRSRSASCAWCGSNPSLLPRERRSRRRSRAFASTAIRRARSKSRKPSGPCWSKTA